MMPVKTDDFESISVVVANRISELLNASVSVVDESGQTVTKRVPEEPSFELKQVYEEQGSDDLRVPIKYGKRQCDLWIPPPTNGEGMSLCVAQTLTELIINQVLGLRPPAGRLRAEEQVDPRPSSRGDNRGGGYRSGGPDTGARFQPPARGDPHRRGQLHHAAHGLFLQRNRGFSHQPAGTVGDKLRRQILPPPERRHLRLRRRW